jgi:hypothetical protein
VGGLATEIEVREGEVTRVTLGGPGRTLIGRLAAPKDLGRTIDWSKVHARLALRAPHFGMPGDEAVWENYLAFLKTAEGEAYCHDPVPIGPDGSFRVKGVPPARYQLIVWVPGPAVGKPDESSAPYAMAAAEVEVGPARDGGDERLTLGTIVLSKRTPLTAPR